MPVAKSYQKLEIVNEPYTVNNKQYVKVKTNTGSLKQVRWYTDIEYKKMYPDEEIQEQRIKSRKEVLGFSQGFVTIFKGDTYAYLDWFRSSAARYNRIWGWFFTSDEELPELPMDLIPIRLEWDKIASDENTLFTENQITTYVESLIYDAGTSEYVGEIGERTDFLLTVTKVIDLENNFGHSSMMIMEDDIGNIFVWTTSSKTLEENGVYTMRGTIKEHRIYRNQKQTILTRCTSVEKIN